MPAWKVMTACCRQTARLCASGFRDCGYECARRISQQGRILYDSTVPAGPFTIRNWTAPCVVVWMLKLSSRTAEKNVPGGHGICAVSDPSGSIRYKLVSGRSRNYEHTMEGPFLLPVRHPGVSVISGHFTVGYRCRGLQRPGCGAGP